MRGADRAAYDQVLHKLDVGQPIARELTDVQQTQVGAIEQALEHLNIVATDDLNSRKPPKLGASAKS